MDFNELLTRFIENVVANIPQLVATLGIIIFNLQQMKKKVATFPAIAKNTQDKLKIDFDETSKVLQKAFESSAKDLKEVVQIEVKGFVDKVSTEMTNIKDEMHSFQESIDLTKDQFNLLTKENKLFMDIIATLLGQDVAKIKSGISAQIINKLNLTKKELEKYPETLMTNMEFLEKTLKEILVVTDGAKLNELLRGLGYEKTKETEELQVKE